MSGALRAGPRALLLGDGGPQPFLGHFRASVLGGRARLSAAGRIAVDADLVEAFTVARRLEATLRTVAEGAWWDTDRHGLLRRAWTLLADLPSVRLGPAGGADLCLLMVAMDERGVGVAGVGLDAVWAGGSGRLGALVPPGHPLLVGPGRPEGLPGVLTLDGEPTRVVAAPTGVEPALPAADVLERRCGVRP